MKELWYCPQCGLQSDKKVILRWNGFVNVFVCPDCKERNDMTPIPQEHFMSIREEIIAIHGYFNETFTFNEVLNQIIAPWNLEVKEKETNVKTQIKTDEKREIKRSQ